MRFNALDDWLDWQETLNPRGIELGLDRVRRVCGRLGLANPPFRVLTVGGTNGKGSVAAYADAILQAAGISSGRYLSPHILRYNERIAVNGVEADDSELCAAFEAVDRARGTEPLTYFEFGTLAAFEIFKRHGVDVAVLEVGLGGRLDAVNVLDADVAVVVSIGLDHMDWLGDTVDAIGREKAGIFRSGRPAFFGSLAPPQGLLDEAARIGADLRRLGQDFDVRQGEKSWCWLGNARRLEHLPLPMSGRHQYANAATAIAAVIALQTDISVEAVRAGMSGARLPGRLQSLGGEPEVVLDVGHNAAAAAGIADYLQENRKPTQAILGMLADKDAPGFVAELAPWVTRWHFVTLPGPRGQTGQQLAERLAAAGFEAEYEVHDGMGAAVANARDGAGQGERVLVLGSFHTVQAFLVYSGLGQDLQDERD